MVIKRLLRELNFVEQEGENNQNDVCQNKIFQCHHFSCHAENSNRNNNDKRVLGTIFLIILAKNNTQMNVKNRQLSISEKESNSFSVESVYVIIVILTIITTSISTSISISI